MDEEGTKGQPTIILVEKSSTKASLEKSYDSRVATIIGVIHILCGIAASFSTLLLLSPRAMLERLLCLEYGALYSSSCLAVSVSAVAKTPTPVSSSVPWS